MPSYYNEWEPYCAQWLRNLIDAGHLPKGDVDERDIRDIKPDDLKGYHSCHFFAGLGGWPYAMQMSGYDGPVWTGSCPCQPFSAAGKGQASSDERHLWPAWFELIRSCKPPVILGEQVEAAIGWGWLDLVYSDLEKEGYTVGASVLPACSVGAPHIRQRLWFVADADTRGRSEQWSSGIFDGERETQRNDADGCGVMGHANGSRRQERTRLAGNDAETEQSTGRKAAIEANPWDDPIWLPCTDGKQRPTQSIIQPLAHGIPNRVAKLRAIGNAIVPSLAAEFIKASIDSIDQISPY